MKKAQIEHALALALEDNDRLRGIIDVLQVRREEIREQRKRFMDWKRQTEAACDKRIEVHKKAIRALHERVREMKVARDLAMGRRLER